jgi:hypothetical protein
MKKLIISGLTIATLMGSFATTASAGFTSTKIGSFIYITGTGSNSGQNSTGTTIGNTTYWSD